MHQSYVIMWCTHKHCSIRFIITHRYAKMPQIRKLDKSAARSGSKGSSHHRDHGSVRSSSKHHHYHRPIYRTTDRPLYHHQYLQQKLQSPNTVHVYKLNKRRESDAKCRANLCHSFEQLRQQIFGEEYTHRVSRVGADLISWFYLHFLFCLLGNPQNVHFLVFLKFKVVIVGVF